MSLSSNLKFFTRSELERILSVARQRSVRDYAMILVGYRHGMRPTEVCRLELDHIDLDGGHILVVRLKNSVTTWQKLQRDEVGVLREWLAARGGSGCKNVFCSVRGRPLDRADFYTNLRKIAVQAGIPPERCRPHALKHSLAVHMGEAGIPVQIIQRRLGHKNIQNTMVYLAIADGLVDQAVENAAANGFVL